MKRDIARELFRSYRSHVRKTQPKEESERRRIDDPQPINSILDELVNTRDWRSGIAEGNLFAQWREIVGIEIAEQSEPITLLDGRLTIQTKTTAWATQLRLLSHEILKKIQSSAPGALVEELYVIGPSAPSWKWGLRTIRGARGPRDTYG